MMTIFFLSDDCRVTISRSHNLTISRSHDLTISRSHWPRRTLSNGKREPNNHDDDRSHDVMPQERDLWSEPRNGGDGGHAGDQPQERTHGPRPRDHGEKKDSEN